MKATLSLVALGATSLLSVTTTPGPDASGPDATTTTPTTTINVDHSVYVSALRRAEASIELVTAENERLRKKLDALEGRSIQGASPDAQPAWLRLDEQIAAGHVTSRKRGHRALLSLPET